MTEKEFEKLTAQALDGLPGHIKEHLDNVAVTVARKPTKEQLTETGTRKSDVLLGLYEGIPQTSWGRGFGDHLPDKITIFQDSIEMFASTSEKIEKMVRDTVWHEIAHHFGYDDEELDEMEREKGIK